MARARTLEGSSQSFDINASWVVSNLMLTKIIVKSISVCNSLEILSTSFLAPYFKGYRSIVRHSRVVFESESGLV